MSEEKFSGVDDTLFIPLAARVTISRRFPEYFYDKKAMELSKLDQVRRINQKSSEYSAMASVSRYFCVDNMVRDFLDNNNGGNVINLGVGLESMNYRIEHANVNFYSIDFESVIDIRRETLGEAPNETLLGSDITDVSWTEKLDTSKPILLIASGVFQYFKKVDVLELIRKLKSVFDNAELIFDATNEVGIRYAQRYVKKTGNMAAMMYFYINDADAFAEEAEVELIEVRGFFNEARAMLGRRLKLFTRIAMKVADDKKRTLILRVGL